MWMYMNNHAHFLAQSNFLTEAKMNFPLWWSIISASLWSMTWIFITFRAPRKANLLNSGIFPYEKCTPISFLFLMTISRVFLLHLLCLTSFPPVTFGVVSVFSAWLALEPGSARETSHGIIGFTKFSSIEKLNLESCTFWVIYRLLTCNWEILYENGRGYWNLLKIIL